jgi:hypothetical protein
LVRRTGAGRVLTWRDAFSLAPTTDAAIVAAADLASDHRLGIWDSLMVAVAAEGDCRLLLSEDTQDGFSWRRVPVVNPFAPKRHPLLDALLDEAGGPEACTAQRNKCPIASKTERQSRAAGCRAEPC